MSDQHVYATPLTPGPLAGHTTASQRHGSAVSWSAIFAGAAAAAALSLILLVLGIGLGLSSVSPWSQAGLTAGTFGISTILWITFTQLAASGMGGYLAGRLRKKWVDVHADESFFRDTAHGFLAWSVATLATAALLTSVIGAIVSGGVQAGAAVAGGAATTAVAAAGAASVAGATSLQGDSSQGMGYFVDSLFRRDTSSSATGTTATADTTAAPIMRADTATSASPGAETTRIFANGLRAGAALPPEDVRYVGQLIAQRTGMSQADAEKRVTETYNRLQSKVLDAETKAKETAEQARKASAYAALWLFVSLMIGAFVASLMATFGGRHRDL